MPPRRSHKKSRTGCQRCKQRKIKCDEIHPTCGNCSKHGVSCDFDDLSASESPPRHLYWTSSHGSVARFSNPPSPALAMVPYQSPDSLSSFSRYTASRPNLELQLLHNYTAMTSKTLAVVNRATTHEAWQVAVPSMAFENPFLMDAILAVSALHLRTLSPNDPDFVRASHGYMAAALSQYSSCLRSGVNATNAEALFATSALIAFQASASRRFQNEDRSAQVEGSGYTLPTQWFHSFQGVKTVVLATWKWLRESERVRPIIQAQPALALELNPRQPKFFGPLLEGLNDQLEETEPCKRIETRQAYEHSVAYLNWAHQKPDRNRILGFPATVSRRFVELIDQHDPRALMIISCFFAMIKAVDDVWWLQGIAKMEVSGITSLVPAEWRDKMDWAVRVSHHEGPMSEETWGERLAFHNPMEVDDEVAGNLHTHIDILAQLAPSVD